MSNFKSLKKVLKKVVIVTLIIILVIAIYLHLYHNVKELFSIKEKKIAVISTIYGGYEKLTNYNNVTNKDMVDWYCFTDGNIQPSDSNWNIIVKPYHMDNVSSKNKNDYSNITDKKVMNMMIGKYYKIQSHKIDILKKYDYLIWADGSLIFRDDFLINIFDLIESNQNAEIFNFKHSERENIKDETYYCKDWIKYKDQDLENQYLEYIKDGFKDDYGLYELTCFIRKTNEEINKIYDLWWLHNQMYSYQDQISYPFVLWKFNRKPDYIIKENVRNNDKFCGNKSHEVGF